MGSGPECRVKVRVKGSEFRVQGLGDKVSRLKIWNLGFRAENSELRS